jgi:hypothetical protein
MNTRKNLTVGFVLGFALLTFSAFAWAGGVQLTCKADKSHKGATGTVSLSENSIGIEAKGLRPNGVYTVWFVNMKPKKHEAGAGQAPYMFKTDAAGNGGYTSTLSESPFGKWEMVMVVLHPDGDPANMKKMVGALSTMIPKSGS